MSIDDIKKRLDQATPGPWKFDDSKGKNDVGCFISESGKVICDFGESQAYYPVEGVAPNEEDTEFISHAQDDIKYLLEQNQRLVKALEKCVELGECQLDYGGSMDALEQVAEVASIALQGYKDK